MNRGNLRHACLLMGLVSAPVLASDLNITAEFIPRVSSPSNIKFVNTTPLSGYCYGNSSNCRPGDFTITFPLTIHREWINPGPIEGQNYQRVDGDWKTVYVTGDGNSQTVALRFRLNLLARRYNLGTLAPGGAEGNISYIANRSGIDGASSGGCQGRIGAGNANMYSFAWGVPTGTVTCTRTPTAQALGPYSGNINEVSVGYELEAPNPFALGNDTYRGDLRYSVGAGLQIDLGSGTYTESEVNFHFELKVQHELRVDFPAGSEHAVLEPDGGWQQWLHSGTPPTRLRRVHPFQIWASAPMKMYLKCDAPLGNQCSIREPLSGHHVPIVVAVTLPNEIRHNGAVVQALPLPLGADQALNFQSVAIAAGRQARLHYSVEAPDVAAMLQHAGRQYSGDVTIVFDAQI